MTNQEIFDIFTAAGMTVEGACAVMGNFMAESGMKANIVQRGMTKLTDEQYTAAVDNGLLDFRDSVGFGYAQWTYGPRKTKLLSFAKAQGVSIGDPAMQCQFCIHELKTDFHTIWADLCSSRDLFQLTQVVCNVYENPAVKNVGTRYEYAKAFLREIKNPQPVPVTSRADPVVRMLQACMAQDGYWPEDRIDGIKTAEFRAKFKEYAADVAAC